MVHRADLRSWSEERAEVCVLRKERAGSGRGRRVWRGVRSVEGRGVSHCRPYEKAESGGGREKAKGDHEGIEEQSIKGQGRDENNPPYWNSFETARLHASPWSLGQRDGEPSYARRRSAYAQQFGQTADGRDRERQREAETEFGSRRQSIGWKTPDEISVPFERILPQCLPVAVTCSFQSEARPRHVIASRQIVFLK